MSAQNGSKLVDHTQWYEFDIINSTKYYNTTMCTRL
jgi:hypothetical protein